jgi:hypothetical protein
MGLVTFTCCLCNRWSAPGAEKRARAVARGVAKSAP